MSANDAEQIQISALSPTAAFQLLGSSPFASDPTFLSRNVQLMPIEKSSQPVKFSSLELLNSLGDGFRNDEYYDTVIPQRQADLKAAWKNIAIPDTPPHCKQIKFLVRRGVPDDLRKEVWQSVSGWTEESQEHPNLYADALARAFGERQPTIFRNYPLFGGLISPSDHYLIAESDEIVKRLLVVLGMEFPRIDHCPEIPDLIQILLTYMSEADVYGIIWCMINRSRGRIKYLLMSKHEHNVFNLGFLQVLAKHSPKLHKHIMSLNIPSKETRNFLSTWFSRLFVSSFPYQVVLRIFDAYINEGGKILYRFALAVLDHNRDALLRTTTSKEFRRVLSSHTATCSVDVDLLIKNAFAYPLKRKEMDLDQTVPVAEDEAAADDSLPVFYRPKITQHSAIIEDDKFEILWAWIPHRLCIKDPFFIYSAEKHGWSLSTISYRCAKEGPTILLIKSDSGAVFGAFLTQPLNTTRTEFYGERDCFLFTLSPGTSCYKWTMTNDLFIKGGNDSFIIGGGGSGYGLYIHRDMWGRSDHSDTFDNPHLDAARPEKFQILALEIYGFR